MELVCFFVCFVFLWVYIGMILISDLGMLNINVLCVFVIWIGFIWFEIELFDVIKVGCG